MLHEHIAQYISITIPHSAPSSTPYPPSCWSQARWSSSDHPGGGIYRLYIKKNPNWMEPIQPVFRCAACSTPNISRMKVNMFQQTLWNLSCKVWPNESSKASKWISQASNIRCYAMGRIILKCIQGNTMILFSLCLFWSLVWPWQAAELGNTGGQSASLLSSSCSYSCWWTLMNQWLQSLDW